MRSKGGSGIVGAVIAILSVTIMVPGDKKSRSTRKKDMMR